MDEDAAARELVHRVGPLWSQRRTVEALGKTAAQLETLAAEGRLLRLEDSDGGVYFPLWQLTTTPVGVAVRPAVVAMLGPLAGQDPWTVALLLRSAAPELDGMTPIEAAAQGRPLSVLVDFAEVVASEWSTH